MAPSRIETLRKTYPGKNKTLFFILNRDLINPTTYNLWECLVGKEKAEKFEVDFEGVYLYSALRSYLVNQRIRPEPYGHLPIESLMRIEDGRDLEKVTDFLKKIAIAQKLQERGNLTIQQYSKLETFLESLKKLSSRYE